MNYSEEDLATLTPEERAVILDDDGAAEANRKALAAIADGGDDEEDDDIDDDNGIGTSVAAEKPAPEAAVDDIAPVVAKADPVEPEEKPEKFRTQYQAAAPVDFDAQLEKLDSDVSALTEKFKAGDIDFDEHQAQLRNIESSRRDLAKAQTKAEIAAEMSEQAANQEWQFTVKSFVKNAARDGGTDYNKDIEKRNDLDGFIKVLANNPANEGKEMEWFLTEAHKRVNALHGVVQPEKKTTLQEAKNLRKAPLDNLPKSLSQVPGSDGPGDVGDEFATIDSLSGDAYESAIAKMSPAQREKFMGRA